MSNKFTILFLVVLALTLTAAGQSDAINTASVLPVSAQAPGIRTFATLPGHVVKALSKATLVPHTADMDEESITLTVVLNLSDPEGASALVQDIANPYSPNFKRTIRPDEYTARFGPTQEAWDAVLTYLEQNGLSLSLGSANRRTMTVTGTRAQAQQAFNVSIDDYELGARHFHGIARDPSVPPAIAPLISSIFGLTDLGRMQPGALPVALTPMSLAIAYDGALTPSTQTNTGGLPPGLNGANQTIGLLEFDGFNPTDVENWLDYANLPSSLINNLSTFAINGGTTPSGCVPFSNQCGTTEVLLDIEAAIGIAQGANVVVYEASPGTDIATAIGTALNSLSDGSEGSGGRVLSTSWYRCEGDVGQSDVTSIDSLISDAAASGVTVFALTGDSGATCINGGNSYPGAAAFPADAPHAVAVGGTSLVNNSDDTYNSESWWLNSGGYGVSQFVPEPSYQSTFYPGATGRSEPDVAMEAAPGIVVCQASATVSPNCTGVVGGTSLATPLMAAIWTLVTQADEDATGLASVAANGYLYKYPHEFHPASSMTGTGNDFAHVGLGSPDITKLVSRLVPPQVSSIFPQIGPASGGTEVTIYGAGFIGISKVSFGGIAATHLTIDSDTQLTVETPEAPGQEVAVKVEAWGGDATLDGVYTYNPKITGISPRNGPIEGGAMVTVNGRALATDETFLFGGRPATGLTCASSKVCTMTTPANPPGSVVVQAQPPWASGDSPITSATTYTYNGPVITSFTPPVGATTGNQFFQIYGVSLGSETTVTTVSFGLENATGVSCPGPGYCFGWTPAHAAGAVPVTVTVNGITTPPATTEFTFEVFPTITAISPNPAAAGTTVTVTGTGFSTTAGQTSFSFFSINVTGTSCSATQCLAVVPEEVNGTATTTAVTVTVNGNTSTDWVDFAYPGKPAPPPCHGTTCN